MNELIELVQDLKKGGVKKQIDKRLSELKAIGKKGKNEIFKELCFCLLTANYDAQKAMTIQEKVGDGFFELSKEDLSKKLRQLGYRFPNVRAKYIVEARQHKDILTDIIKSYKTDKGRREWFAKHVKGLGFKEASHFLRNIGCPDCAIIDFHIVDILTKYTIIKKPKTLTPKAYMQIEKVLQKMADRLSMSLAELDFYLWYLETGKVLK